MEPIMTKPLFSVRKITDLKDMLDQSVALHADKSAFMVKHNGIYEEITYKKYKEDVYALGTAFANFGVGKEHIALIGENRYEWCVTFMAATCGGGVIIPLDKELPKNEIVNLINRSDAKAIIFSDKYKEIVKEYMTKDTELKLAINMDAVSDDDDIKSFSGFILSGEKLIREGNNEFGKTKIDREQLAGIFFTSGTTDLAKGVMLSHKNLSSNIMMGLSMFEVKKEDRVLSILPMHHTYECTCDFLLMTSQGVTIYFCEGLKYIQKNLQEAKPTILLVVPLLLESMYKKIWNQIEKKRSTWKVKTALAISNLLLKLNIDIRKRLFKDVLSAFGGELNIAVAGGAAVRPEVLKGLREFGIYTIQGYGLTESSPLAALNPILNSRDAAIGLPLQDVEMKIIEPDENGNGEIMIRSDAIMMGYYENEEATKAVLDADGWYHSGDIGYRDKDGFFYITGRKKNVIVTKNGKNIFPEEVESYINRSPYILESIVYGKDLMVERETLVCAIVVPNYDTIKEFLGKEELNKEEVFGIIDEEIKKHNKEMPLYKMVKEFEIRETEFEKTTTKKIKRRTVVK